MEAKRLLDIVEEADCCAEVCFLDSNHVYKVLGWAKRLIEISFKVGYEAGLDKGRRERQNLVEDFIRWADERIADLEAMPDLLFSGEHQWQEKANILRNAKDNLARLVKEEK